MPEYSLSAKWHTPCFEKLSALDWSGRFGLVSHGVKIGVRVSDPSLISLLQDKLPANCTRCDLETVDVVLSVVLGGKPAGSRHRHYHLVYHNHSVFSRSHNLDDVIEGFQSCLAVTVATLARRRVFIHAGAVGWQGKAIIFPGKSHSGKSTLVQEMVKAGASYLSDEFAVLDFKGRVHPYHKPIAIRQVENGRQVDVSIDSIGGTTQNKSLPLGLVVDTKFQSGAPWLPKTLSPGEGMLSLLSNCAAARLSPERCLRAMERASQRSRFVSSPREEAAAVTSHILDLLNCEPDIGEMAGSVRQASASDQPADLLCPI